MLLGWSAVAISVVCVARVITDAVRRPGTSGVCPGSVRHGFHWGNGFLVRPRCPARARRCCRARMVTLPRSFYAHVDRLGVPYAFINARPARALAFFCEGFWIAAGAWCIHLIVHGRMHDPHMLVWPSSDPFLDFLMPSSLFEDRESNCSSARRVSNSMYAEVARTPAPGTRSRRSGSSQAKSSIFRFLPRSFCTMTATESTSTESASTAKTNLLPASSMNSVSTPRRFPERTDSREQCLIRSSCVHGRGHHHGWRVLLVGRDRQLPGRQQYEVQIDRIGANPRTWSLPVASIPNVAALALLAASYASGAR